MKTVRTIHSKEALGKILPEYFRILEQNDLVEIVVRYKQKQPILLKKGTKRTYPIFASPNHPKSKAIHEFIIKMAIEKRHHSILRGSPYHIRHHRSERKKK